jgi:hypothetical protein
VPEATKKIVEDDIKPVYKSDTRTTTSTNTGIQHNVYHNRATTTYKKKGIETFIIKRTTKYPISRALEQMKIKIEAIKGGTYKAPKLAEIPSDKESKEDEKKEDKSETTDQAHMEELYGYAGGYPGF